MSNQKYYIVSAKPAGGIHKGGGGTPDARWARRLPWAGSPDGGHQRSAFYKYRTRCNLPLSGHESKATSSRFTPC